MRARLGDTWFAGRTVLLTWSPSWPRLGQGEVGFSARDQYLELMNSAELYAALEVAASVLEETALRDRYGHTSCRTIPARGEQESPVHVCFWSDEHWGDEHWSDRAGATCGPGAVRAPSAAAGPVRSHVHRSRLPVELRARNSVRYVCPAMAPMRCSRP